MSVTPSVEPSRPAARATPPPPGRRGWSGGRVGSLVVGCVVGLFSLTLLSFAGLATWETNTQRDAAGYLTADPHTITTGGYVVTSDEVAEVADQVWGDLIGTARIRVTPTDAASAVFIGVAPKAAVDSYLSGVGRTVVTGWFPFETRDALGSGAAPRTGPTDAAIWTRQASGSGTQTLTWRPESDTTVVVMNADATAGLSVTTEIGATVPDLAWVAVGLFIVGALLLGAAAVLIAMPIVRMRKERASS